MADARCSLLRAFAYLLVFFVLFTNAQNGFNRDVCLKRVRDGLDDGTISRNSSIFLRDEDGLPMSEPETPFLTIGGCEQVCGKSFGWYRDVGPRLSTWLIPVLLLISNMEVSPLDKRRYLMILHLLGDPIDSLYSLLLKMEAWSRCHSMARAMCRRSGRRVRNLATVLGGFEELVGFHANPADVYTRIMQSSRVNSVQVDAHIARAAQKLADSRTDERLRTLLATVLYIYQLVSAFIATVGGGNTSPPGGRIGMTMFMTWILPSILISNAIGCFTSRRTCFDILDSFVQQLDSETSLWSELRDAVPELRQYSSVEDFFESFSWSGAIYSYRPSKQLKFSTGPQDRSRSLIFLLALAPIVTSSVVASIILWHTPPIGINCRNLLVFSIIIFMFTSAFFTAATSWAGLHGETHWHVVLVKDACLAIPFVLLVFFATSGLFNSCWCWSGVYSLGAKARVPMNPVADFTLYGRTIYPILVSVCLILLILAFVAMMWMGWRGWNVMRWSEKERQDEWNRARGTKVELHPVS
ncbi:hypothetical protein K458DRAFT_342637 [Lentithecium fluviatile CBS 122367]|uniref:Uncharacterized protein n=1 Tax=Lentithecium fluviatile CBS 122367 TaxID=1168545 RepID=A0A6G1IWA1_9PLEO|nr:hypothetical protein K458DRAFT_342637 [Lentithecium fluviatile CBS 122367]